MSGVSRGRGGGGAGVAARGSSGGTASAAASTPPGGEGGADLDLVAKLVLDPVSDTHAVGVAVLVV